VILETVIAAYTQHWMIVLGPFILLVAMFAKRGIYGSFLAWERWMHSTR
jgi:branched-chain amino acid transport system permease protein